MAGEKIEFLSAILLTSPDAARLAAFYRDVVGLPLEEERHGIFDCDAVHWVGVVLQEEVHGLNQRFAGEHREGSFGFCNLIVTEARCPHRKDRQVFNLRFEPLLFRDSLPFRLEVLPDALAVLAFPIYAEHGRAARVGELHDSEGF